MSDPAVPAITPANNDNLTSILNQLESNYFAVEPPNFEDILRRINEFAQFLNSTILEIVLSGRNRHRQRCCYEISNVQKAIFMIHKQAKKRSKAMNHFPMSCRVCGSKILITDKKDFWGQLQHHEHIEKLWANYLVGGTEAVESEVEKGPEAMSARTFEEIPWRESVRYDQSILDFCYPREFMRQLYSIDGVPEFTMQFRGTGTSCLLCGIPATLTGSSLMDHMQGSRHSSKANMPLSRDILHAYHSRFSKLPPNYQAHSIYFTTKRPEEVKCRLCKESVKYVDLEAHILGPKHRNAITTRLRNVKLAVQEPLLNKASTVYSGVEKESDSLATTSRLNVQAEAATAPSSSIAVNSSHPTNSSNSEDDDKPAEFTFNFSIPQEEEASAPVSPQEPALDELSYDPLIMEVAYPERIRNMSYKMDSLPYYTILMLSDSDSFCLLCRCSLEGRSNSLKVHLRGNKHQKNATTKEVVSSVQAYHTGFMQLPFELQPHVIYFCPNSQRKTRCKLCGEHVLYGSSLEAHIFGIAHKTGVLQRSQCGFYKMREILLKRATRIYSVENGEKSDEAGSNNTGSPAMNGVVEATNNAAAKSKKIIHDIVSSITNPESLSFFERLENRFRSHLNLLEERAVDIYCKCCDTTILKTRFEVKKHIISDEHKEKAGVPNKRYQYICDVCSYSQRKEAAFQEHFQQEPHKRRLEEMPTVKREYLTEYECRTCNVIIFGDTVALRKHRSYIRNKKQRYRKEITLSENAKLLFKSESHISSLSTQLVFNANYVVEKQDNVWACCQAIETALNCVFESCHAHPFGSRVSGLGNQNSDLDVFVDIGDMYLGQNKQDAKSQEKIVKEAAKVFKKFPGKVFTHINPVPTARTPIVQIFHTVTQLDCDLSFRHGLSVENTRLLRVCIGIQPIAQHLILMLKQWSQYSKLDEHITTYALAMMTIFYLQTRGLLLSIKQLKTLNPQPAQIIDGWETINYTLSSDALRACVAPYTGTLKQLISDFFKYYFEFKYETNVICPLLGHTIKKSDFNDSPTGDLLPPEMHSYIRKLRTEDEPEFFRALSPFCVQDPFDLSHNLTKACSEYAVEKLQILCELSVKYLASVN